MNLFLHVVETPLVELDSHWLQELSARNSPSVLDPTEIESKALEGSPHGRMLETLLSPQLLQLLDRLLPLIDHTETGCSLNEGELRLTAVTHTSHEFTQVQ